jgi:hypothetical protein
LSTQHHHTTTTGSEKRRNEPESKHQRNKLVKITEKEEHRARWDEKDFREENRSIRYWRREGTRTRSHQGGET